MMSSEAAAVARRAAEIIQQRGKADGSPPLVDDGGPVCLWAAIGLAMDSNYWNLSGNEPMFKSISAALRALLPPSGYFNLCGMDWNDRDDVDERDVAKVLLQVADRLDFGGVS